MEYNQNLYGHFRKSNAQLVLGGLTVLIGFAWIVLQFFEGNGFHVFDYIYSIFFFLWGIYQIAAGRGYNLEDHFTRRSSVHIDDEMIRIRTVARENIIYWNNVKMIGFRGGYLRVTYDRGRSRLVSLSVLDQEYVKRILNLIRDIAIRRGIKFNIGNTRLA